MDLKLVDIDRIKGAEYNPRKIDESKLGTLEKSIKELGFIIPIIVNKENNTIIAGHQRTKTAKKVGLKQIPAFLVKNINLADEINFNQIHNGAEKTPTYKSKVKTSAYKHNDFNEIAGKDININRDNMNMAVVNQIRNMILKYGNIFSSVVSNGIIIYQEEYAYTCKLMGIDCNAYILESEKLGNAKDFLNQSYGEFSYENLKKNTFVQGLAQMFRDPTGEKNKKRNASKLYEEMVYPFLEKNKDIKSILDFGCGKGAYINELSKKYEAIGVEFYNNNGSAINVSKGNKQIDSFISYLGKDKKFDLVICDSVLNSVDSLEAEESIMDILNYFSKDIVFLSGRSIKAIKYINSGRKKSRNKDKLHFLDKDGFTASFRKGNWYYQKFHSEKQVKELCEKHGFEVIEYTVTANAWKAKLKKVRQVSDENVKKAIQFEFNLPLPNGKSYNRQNDVLKAIDML